MLPLLLLLSGNTATAHRYPFAQVAQRYEEEQQRPATQVVEDQVVEQQTVYGSGAPAGYKFSYTTGARGVSDAAHHFREESRDESGYVVGKYGYVDPYGQLR